MSPAVLPQHTSRSPANDIDTHISFVATARHAAVLGVCEAAGEVVPVPTGVCAASGPSRPPRRQGQEPKRSRVTEGSDEHDPESPHDRQHVDMSSAAVLLSQCHSLDSSENRRQASSITGFAGFESVGQLRLYGVLPLHHVVML